MIHPLLPLQNEIDELVVLERAARLAGKEAVARRALEARLQREAHMAAQMQFLHSTKGLM